MTRKRKTYTARARRDGGWWTITIDEVDGAFSQARALSKVEYMARDALALLLDVPSASFDVKVEVELPPELRQEVDAIEATKREAERAQEAQARAARTAAAHLHGAGFTYRDTGLVLGISHQRAEQLVKGR